MGFCLGGLMTYLTAARHNLDAAVAYHGGDTEKLPRRGAGHQTAPLLMHLAEEDEFISKDCPGPDQGRRSRTSRAPRSTAIRAATTLSRATPAPTTTAKAAALANGRTWSFLTEHLGSGGAS